MRTLNAVALLLVVVGALNWGLVGFVELDLVAWIFGEEFGATNAAVRIFYILVGAAGLYVAAMLPSALRGMAEHRPAGRATKAAAGS